MGYEMEYVGSWSRVMGGANAILRMPDGLLMAGADPRRSSYAVAAD
jgi:gamma-glutamyltranspeptidase/glutathione hydrolase